MVCEAFRRFFPLSPDPFVPCVDKFRSAAAEGMARGECLSPAHDPTDLPAPRDGPSAVAVCSPPTASRRTRPLRPWRHLPVGAVGWLRLRRRQLARRLECPRLRRLGFRLRRLRRERPLCRDERTGRPPSAARPRARSGAAGRRCGGLDPARDRTGRVAGRPFLGQRAGSPCHDRRAAVDRAPGPVCADRAAEGSSPASLPAWADVTNAAQYKPASSRTFRRVIRRCWSASTAGRRPISRATPAPRNARRPPCASPTARRADNSKPGRPAVVGPGAAYAAGRDRARRLGFALSRCDAAMILDAATAAPSRHDCRLDAGTHLMHLEAGRPVSIRPSAEP